MVAVLDNGRQDFYVGIYPPTGDYEFLDNQPAIDGVVLTKSTTKADLDLDKVFQYRGQVASYNKLPTKNRVIGDTYNVQDTGENYAWNGSSWDLLTGFEAVYWRNGALESQGSTLTIDSDKNPISNLILEDITDVTATKDEVNELHEGTAVKNDFIKLHSVTADASELNILDGATLTTTELNYVNGVTSAIQTQLNGKEPTITGAATTITSSNLTKNRAVISNNSGKVAVSDTTSTELGYVHGVTSAIQTQLNGKEATISDLETIRTGAGKGATALQPNTAITAGTGTKITYDTNGLVTAGTTLEASDIPDISGTYQTVISDLETIRTGAGKGTTSVQPSSDNDAPTTSTVGTLCQLYVDTSTQTGYMCVGIDNTDPENIIYTWKQITV